MFGTLFGFKGRLSRAGYFEALLSIVLIDVALVLGQKYVEAYGLPGGYGPASQLSSILVMAAPWVIVLFTIWSVLAIGVKRCHDRGRPGVLLLLGLIPVFGWLWLLVDLLILAGNKGKNRYGRAPHGHESEAQNLWTAPAPGAAAPAPAVHDGQAPEVVPAAAVAAPVVEAAVQDHTVVDQASADHSQGDHAGHEERAADMYAPVAYSPVAEAHRDQGHAPQADDASVIASDGYEVAAIESGTGHGHEVVAQFEPLAAPESHGEGDPTPALVEPLAAVQALGAPAHGEQAPESAPRSDADREIPSFVQRWATVYYDPSPAKLDGHGRGVELTPIVAADDDHAAAHALGPPSDIPQSHAAFAAEAHAQGAELASTSAAA